MCHVVGRHADQPRFLVRLWLVVRRVVQPHSIDESVCVCVVNFWVPLSTLSVFYHYCRGMPVICGSTWLCCHFDILHVF